MAAGRTRPRRVSLPESTGPRHAPAPECRGVTVSPLVPVGLGATGTSGGRVTVDHGPLPWKAVAVVPAECPPRSEARGAAGAAPAGRR